MSSQIHSPATVTKEEIPLRDPIALGLQEAHTILSNAAFTCAETEQSHKVPKAIRDTLEHARDYVGDTLVEYLKGKDIFKRANPSFELRASLTDPYIESLDYSVDDKGASIFVSLSEPANLNVTYSPTEPEVIEFLKKNREKERKASDEELSQVCNELWENVENFMREGQLGPPSLSVKPYIAKNASYG